MKSAKPELVTNFINGWATVVDDELIDENLHRNSSDVPATGREVTENVVARITLAAIELYRWIGPMEMEQLAEIAKENDRGKQD